MERGREVTFRCLEGGMEWGTATGLAACELDWNGDNKYAQAHISEIVPVVLIER